jgi:hypothetical protein
VESSDVFAIGGGEGVGVGVGVILVHVTPLLQTILPQSEGEKN